MNTSEKYEKLSDIGTKELRYRKNLIFNSIEESISLKKETIKNNLSNIILMSELIIKTIKNGNKILIFGNGGSAADAQHIAAEFVGRFEINRKPFPAIALTTDTSIITAISNDFSYDDIFKKQVEALAKEGDLLWGISTSGNSENVLNAMDLKARFNKIGFTGNDGGKMISKCDYNIIVPSNNTARIQEIHIMLAHIICKIIETSLFENN